MIFCVLFNVIKIDQQCGEISGNMDLYILSNWQQKANKKTAYLTYFSYGIWDFIVYYCNVPALLWSILYKCIVSISINISALIIYIHWLLLWFLHYFLYKTRGWKSVFNGNTSVLHLQICVITVLLRQTWFANQNCCTLINNLPGEQQTQ